MESRFPDCPKSLKRQEVREERFSFLRDPSVQRLNDYVDEMRQERQENGLSGDIPYFDPMDGGVEAKCLFLFEAPGGKAVESTFISRNNNDQTAENFFKMNEEVRLDRRLTVSWNVVPWALRPDGANKTPTRVETLDAVQKHLHCVLDLVNPEVVVLFGNSAHQAEETINAWSGEVCLIKTNHPSPQNINRNEKMWGKITAALLRAKSCM